MSSFLPDGSSTPDPLWWLRHLLRKHAAHARIESRGYQIQPQPGHEQLGRLPLTEPDGALAELPNREPGPDPMSKVDMAAAAPAAAEQVRVSEAMATEPQGPMLPQEHPELTPMTHPDEMGFKERLYIESINNHFQSQDAITRAVQSASAGVRDAPGIAGALGRLARPDTELEQLIERGDIELSPAEQVIRYTGMFAPAVGEVIATRGASAAIAPKVPGAAGAALSAVGRGSGQGSRVRSALIGAAEGVPTDIAHAIETGSAVEGGIGTAAGAGLGALMPGKAQTKALVKAVAAGADPLQAAKTIVSGPALLPPAPTMKALPEPSPIDTKAFREWIYNTPYPGNHDKVKQFHHLIRNRPSGSYLSQDEVENLGLLSTEIEYLHDPETSRRFIEALEAKGFKHTVDPEADHDLHMTYNDVVAPHYWFLKDHGMWKPGTTVTEFNKTKLLAPPKKTVAEAIENVLKKDPDVSGHQLQTSVSLIADDDAIAAMSKQKFHYDHVLPVVGKMEDESNPFAAYPDIQEFVDMQYTNYNMIPLAALRQYAKNLDQYTDEQLDEIVEIAQKRNEVVAAEINAYEEATYYNDFDDSPNHYMDDYYDAELEAYQADLAGSAKPVPLTTSHEFTEWAEYDIGSGMARDEDYVRRTAALMGQDEDAAWEWYSQYASGGYRTRSEDYLARRDARNLALDVAQTPRDARYIEEVYRKIREGENWQDDPNLSEGTRMMAAIRKIADENGIEVPDEIDVFHSVRNDSWAFDMHPDDVAESLERRSGVHSVTVDRLGLYTTRLLDTAVYNYGGSIIARLRVSTRGSKVGRVGTDVSGAPVARATDPSEPGTVVVLDEDAVVSRRGYDRRDIIDDPTLADDLEGALTPEIRNTVHQAIKEVIPGIDAEELRRIAPVAALAIIGGVNGIADGEDNDVIVGLAAATGISRRNILGALVNAVRRSGVSTHVRMGLLPFFGAGVAASQTVHEDDMVGRAVLGGALGLAAALGPSGLRALGKSQLAERMLTPGGELVSKFPKELRDGVRAALARQRGRAGEAEAQIRQARADLARAVDRTYGGNTGVARTLAAGDNPLAGLPDETLEAMSEVFNNMGMARVDPSNPQSVAKFAEDVARINEMYRSGDTESAIAAAREVYDTIPDEIIDPMLRLRAAIDDYHFMFQKEGIVEGELATAFDARAGIHLTRSYRVFDDPEWARNAPEALGEEQWEQIKNSFKNWYREQLKDEDISEDELELILEDFLAVGDASSPLGFIASGALGRTNSKVLAARKSIPSEVRQLWGEHTDPFVNFARTITNQAYYISNYKFWRDLREMDNGTLFAPRDERVQGMTHQFGDNMGPLSGLYTTPELGKALDQHFVGKPRDDNMVMQALGWLTTTSKISKTIGSQVTQIRNLIGNVEFAVAQGLWFNPARMFRALKAGGLAIAEGSGLKNDTGWREYHNKLLRLGVLDDSARAGELRAALNSLTQGSMYKSTEGILANPVFGGVTRTGRMVKNAAFGAYRAEDDVWKIISFSVERERYAKAMPDLSPDELDQMAADATRATFPAFSMTPELVNQLRRYGGFISFPAEVVRTAFGTMKQIEKDLANPATKGIAMQRIAGVVTAMSVPFALAAGSRRLHNVTLDQEDAIRELMPPWSENSQLLHLGPNDDGEIEAVDLSFVSPYSYLRAPLIALLRGESWQEAMAGVAKESFGPVVAQSPAFSEFVRYIQNADRTEDELELAANSLMSALMPGIVDQYGRALTERSRWYRPLKFGPTRSVNRNQELIALTTGFRTSKINMAESARIKFGAFNSRWGDAGRGERNAEDAVASGVMGRSTLARNRRDTAETKGDLLLEYARFTKALRTLGLTPGRISAIMGNAGISQQNRGLINRYANEDI